MVGLQLQMLMYRTYENVFSPTLEIWATQIKLQDILVSQLYMQMELMHIFPGRETIKLILLHQVSESIPRLLQHVILFGAEEVNPITKLPEPQWQLLS